MRFWHRPMGPKDVREAVKAVAAHPVLAIRYGPRVADLEGVWLRLLCLDATHCGIIEENRGTSTHILGVGFATFVSESFIREMKTPPLRWIARELVERIARDRSPVLSNTEVRTANSTTGLNVAVWQSGIRPEELCAELANESITSFHEAHCGFLLKEMIAQPDCIGSWTAIRNTGFRFFNMLNGSYGEYPEECDISQPFIVGITRELAACTPGAWASSLFFSRPPRVGFSRSEQRLLISTLDGATDEDVSDKLSISRSAVKKTWRTIYERASLCIPECFLHGAEADTWRSERGKEKRRRILAYVSKHPEELRPISRKLLQGRAAQSDLSKRRRSGVGISAS